MDLSLAVPWGRTPGKYNFLWGLLGGVWTIILPCRWGKWGRFGFRKPGTLGKTGDFVKEIGRFQVVNSRKTAVQMNTGSLSPRGGEKWRRAEAQEWLCKSISIVLFLIFTASVITMEDNWITLDFRFSLCKLIAGQEKFTVVADALQCDPPLGGGIS